jgi:multiple sugar transport system permease protein
MASKLRENLTAYLLLAPFLLLFAVFLGYPVFYSFALSLRKVTLTTDWFHIFDDMRYCGLENYRHLLFEDREFWWSLALTLMYAGITIPAGVALSLMLAMLLSNKVRGVQFFRSAFFLPNVLDPLVVGLLWVFICAPQYGALEVVLRGFLGYFIPVSPGQPLFPSGLLGNAWTVLPAIGLAMVLKGAGFGMILFLTAIQNIPGELYEAADLDGASEWDKLIHITIPFVKPIIVFMVITGVMGAMNAFTEIYAMTGGDGGPAALIVLPDVYGLIHLVAYVLLWVSLGGLIGLFGRFWAEQKNVLMGFSPLLPFATGFIGLAGAWVTLPNVVRPVRFTARAASVAGFYLYKTFERGDYGYAATIAFALMAVALIISVLNMWVAGRGE